MVDIVVRKYLGHFGLFISINENVFPDGWTVTQVTVAELWVWASLISGKSVVLPMVLGLTWGYSVATSILIYQTPSFWLANHRANIDAVINFYPYFVLFCLALGRNTVKPFILKFSGSLNRASRKALNPMNSIINSLMKPLETSLHAIRRPIADKNCNRTEFDFKLSSSASPSIVFDYQAERKNGSANEI